MAMNVERMELAVATLREIAEKERGFNLGFWVKHQRPEKKKDRKDEFCGTTACACGWFALTPALSSQGFKMLVRGYNEITDRYQRKLIGSIEEMNTFAHKKSICSLTGDVYYVEPGTELDFNEDENSSGFNAVAKFFGISWFKASELFSPREFVYARGDAAEVADHMQVLIDAEKKRLARNADRRAKKAQSNQS